MFKRRYINILILITAFLLIPALTSAKENKVAKVRINLFDTDLSFPLLRKALDDGSFDDSGLAVQYTPGKGDVKNLPGITLVSSILKRNSITYASFKLYSPGSINQDLRIEWEIRLDDDYEDVRDESIERIVTLARKNRKRDINRIIQSDAADSLDIENIEAVYEETATGSQLQAYDVSISTRPSSTHRFWRAMTEVMFGNALGIANYWVNKHTNMVDWEYQPTRQGFKEKLKDGWSLDTNNFRTNTLYHIYSGMVCYQIGRSNYYGYFGSTMWALGGSLFWEYIGEYREQVSTNDVIFTTMGGVLLGESFRRCSFYIEKAMGGGVLGTILATIFDPARVVNRALDRISSENFKFRIYIANPAQMAADQAMRKQFRF